MYLAVKGFTTKPECSYITIDPLLSDCSGVCVCQSVIRWSVSSSDVFSVVWLSVCLKEAIKHPATHTHTQPSSQSTEDNHTYSMLWCHTRTPFQNLKGCFAAYIDSIITDIYIYILSPYSKPTPHRKLVVAFLNVKKTQLSMFLSNLVYEDSGSVNLMNHVYVIITMSLYTFVSSRSHTHTHTGFHVLWGHRALWNPFYFFPNSIFFAQQIPFFFFFFFLSGFRFFQKKILDSVLMVKLKFINQKACYEIMKLIQFNSRLLKV